MRETIVINLIGGPGSGKSTCASGIFYELKKLGINCELSLEFVKDKVWEESYKVLDDQLYVFGKQYHKLFRLKDKVDVIITDSPLLISIHYNKISSQHFNNLVVEQYHTFNNLMYFINRSETYQSEGRLQTKEESEMIDRDIKTIGKHINNALNEELKDIPTVAKFATVQKEGNRDVSRNIEYYNLDMILSVG